MDKILKSKVEEIGGLIKSKDYKMAKERANDLISEYPDNSVPYNILCSIHILLKDFNKAISIANENITKIGEDYLSYFYLAQAEAALSNQDAAIDNIINSINQNKDFPIAYTILRNLLHNTPAHFVLKNKGLEEIYLYALEKNYMKIDEIINLILRLYLSNYQLSKPFFLNNADFIDGDINSNIQILNKDIFEKELFLKTLNSIIIANEFLERYLTYKREILLKEISNGKSEEKKSTSSKITLKFILAIANQNFRNGYCWNTNDNEKKLLKKLVSKLNNNLENGIIDEKQIAILASYEYIFNHDLIKKIVPKKIKRNSEIKELIKTHLQNPIDEEKLFLKIKLNEKLKEITDNNYNINFSKQISFKLLKNTNLIDFIKNNLNPVQILGNTEPINSPNILLLGSQSVAKSFFYHTLKDAKIYSVSNNRSLLAYGERVASVNKIKNINFIHGDITTIDEINNKFDLIDVNRSINYYKNGKDLIDNLCSKLNDVGYMRIELISENSFKPLKKLEDLINDSKTNYKFNNISDLRTFIRNIEDEDLERFSRQYSFFDGHRLQQHLNNSIESFITLNDCDEIIKKLELKFLGWSDIIDTNLRQLFFNNYNSFNKEDILYNNLLKWADFEKKQPFNTAYNYSMWLKK